MNSKLLRFVSSLLLLLFVFQSCSNSQEPQTKEKVNTSNIKFDYTPQNNLYSVSFSGTPTIKETMFPVNGNYIKSETAELILANELSFQRAESLSIDLGLSRSYNKESLYEMLTQYAEMNGVIQRLTMMQHPWKKLEPFDDRVYVRYKKTDFIG